MPQKRKGARLKSETQIIADQDLTMAQYKKIGVIKNEDEVRMLHQFFSPITVPRGMTASEVRQCIAMHPLRDWHRNRWGSEGNSLIGLALGRPLPNEFKVFGRNITRAEFALGMNKLKAEIILLLSSDICGVHLFDDNHSGETIPEQLIHRCKPFFATIKVSVKRRKKLQELAKVHLAASSTKKKFPIT